MKKDICGKNSESGVVGVYGQYDCLGQLGDALNKLDRCLMDLLQKTSFTPRAILSGEDIPVRTFFMPSHVSYVHAVHTYAFTCSMCLIYLFIYPYLMLLLFVHSFPMLLLFVYLYRSYLSMYIFLSDAPVVLYYHTCHTYVCTWNYMKLYEIIS